MKKFIFSDLHGLGNVYYSMIKFLDNLATEDEISLFINGDLIDRGSKSGEMLLDIKNRIDNNISFPITYLAGNHELMMYQIGCRLEDKDWNIYGSSNWLYSNGGYTTVNYLNNNLTFSEIKEVLNFIGNLKIYHKFKETINNKRIVLILAAFIKPILNDIDLRVKHDDNQVEIAVWTRKGKYSYQEIGNKNYFTIIGHTPVEDKYGYLYDSYQETFNIDGGCSAYIYGLKEYNHFPLVEVEDDKLNILTFNIDGQIIYGNYFYNNSSHKMNNNELDKYKKYLLK